MKLYYLRDTFAVVSSCSSIQIYSDIVILLKEVSDILQIVQFVFFSRRQHHYSLDMVLFSVLILGDV